jgi:hypothetical protein
MDPDVGGSNLTAFRGSVLHATTGLSSRISTVNGKRFLLWALFAVAIRVSVMWFSHPWDITTFYNLFSNLAADVNPYDELARLSRIFYTSVSNWVPSYEYYAYPPGLIYLYYIPAKAWSALVGSIAPHWLLPSGGYVIPPSEVLNPVFLVLFKAPILIADVAIGWLVARSAGFRLALAYLFNPLVILISATWSFDALAVLCVVAAYLLARKDRMGLAGVALGIGGVLKIFPLVLLPALLLWLLKRGRRGSAMKAGLACVAVTIVAVIPMWDGVLQVMQFHGARKGGGLTVHQLLYLYDTAAGGPSLWLQVGLSPAVGYVTLVTALSLAYVWIWRSDPPLIDLFVVTVGAFLLGSKLVNEQFGIWLLPLLLISLSLRYSARRWKLYWLISMVPLVFALVNVPFSGFLYPFGHWGLIPFDGLASMSGAVIGSLVHAMILSGLAVTYLGLLIAVVQAHTRAPSRSSP